MIPIPPVEDKNTKFEKNPRWNEQLSVAQILNVGEGEKIKLSSCLFSKELERKRHRVRRNREIEPEYTKTQYEVCHSMVVMKTPSYMMKIQLQRNNIIENEKEIKDKTLAEYQFPVQGLILILCRAPY